MMDICMGLESGACAAWVQAWGSIGAILATGAGVYLAHWLQQRHERRHRKAERVDRLEVLFTLINSTANSAHYVQQQLSDKTRIQAARLGRPNIDLDVVQSLGELLAPISLHELDDPEVAFEILLLTKNAQQLRELALMSIKHIEAMPDPDVTTALQSMRTVREHADKSRAALRARIDLIKAQPT